MSKHTAVVTWLGSEASFDYETYSRDHNVHFGTGSTISASAAADFKGNVTLTNPEEMLVGALSSCHMLTFLAVAARKQFIVTSYRDEAVGVLEKNEQGRMAVTHVTLSPKVTFTGEQPDAATLSRLHESAHRGCFIANSVNTKITIA